MSRFDGMSSAQLKALDTQDFSDAERTEFRNKREALIDAEAKIVEMYLYLNGLLPYGAKLLRCEVCGTTGCDASVPDPVLAGYDCSECRGLGYMLDCDYDVTAK